MKNRYSVVFCLLALVVACSKDNQGKPSLSIESITSIVPAGGNMEAKIKFTQNNGKLSGGTFVAIRNRLNQTPLPPSEQPVDTITGPIPTFPDKNKGDMVFTLPWVFLHESDIENDTIVFKFAAIDTDNHSSDTVVSEKIVILFQ